MLKNANTLKKPIVLILSLMLVATFIFIPTLVIADESTIPAEIADEEAAAGEEIAESDAVEKEIADPDGETVSPEARHSGLGPESISDIADAAIDAVIDTQSAGINPLAAVSPTAAIGIPSNDLKKGGANIGDLDISQLTVESSTITFAGRQWLVIGKNDGITASGVYGSDAPVNSVTVVAANTGEDTFGTSQFCYLLEYFGYIFGSSDYSGSDLQAKMNSIYNDFSEADRSAVNSRTLDGISGSPVNDAYVWPLSIGEYNALSDDAGRAYGSSDNYWLRSANSSTESYIGFKGGDANPVSRTINESHGVRPALNLSLTPAIFKSAAAVDAGFLAASTTTDLTKTGLVVMDDTTTTLPAISVSGTPTITTAGGIRAIALTVSDSAFARVPTGDEYIGVRLVNKADKTKIYYAGVTPGSDINWNTTVSLPLNQVAGGMYDIYVCAERATAGEALDIAGPISNGGTVYVPGIDADITRIFDNAVTWSDDDGTSTSPKTAAVTVESTVPAITAEDFTKSDPKATLTLYTDSDFEDEVNDAVPLVAGSNEVYVKVVAEDGITALYCKVTIYRSTITPVPTLVLNSSVISFAGQQWYVIGKNIPVQGAAEGVNSTRGNSVTLLLSDKGEDFDAGSGPYGGSIIRAHLGGDDYASNPEQIGDLSNIGNWDLPNEYLGSALHQKMYELYATTGGFLENEKTQILPRTLSPQDDVNEPLTKEVPNQKLWPLSRDEWSSGIFQSDAGRFGGSGWFWLRSPQDGHYNRVVNVVNAAGGDGFFHEGGVWYDYGVRPAFTLDLSSVVFTSVASGDSSPDGVDLQTPVNITTDWTNTTAPKKLTFSDAALGLSLSTTDPQKVASGDDLTLNYENATTGTRISCLLVNEDASGKSYYENLTTDNSADTGIATLNTDDIAGTVTLNTDGIAGGDYTLQIFTEEVNGEDESNFCSVPATLDVTIDPSTDAGITHVAGNAVTWSGDDGTSAAALKTTSVAVESTMPAITAEDFTMSNANATLTLYANGTFSGAGVTSVPLDAGSNTVYVKVVAEDGTTTLYYKVTITVKQAPWITTGNLPSGKVDVAYRAALAAIGYPASAWSLTKGRLPFGLTLNESTGVISGTPTGAGIYTFTVRAANGTTPDASKELSIRITADGLTDPDGDDDTNGTDDDDSNTDPNGGVPSTPGGSGDSDPSKSGSKSGSSDTSDDFDIGLFSGTLILAAAGLIACVTARRRLGKHA
ncbi:MAG: putative Ig domain-containing protein [Clostridiales Family XIII bacterium]|jgi:hypothetical protein|nr:putative Ig domain-containing protein [Clostridiales Family XIII bacterium]